MPRGGLPKVYDATLVAEVVRLYVQGMTQSEVAQALGLTQKIVWNLMRRHGIDRRRQAKRDQRGEKNHMWRGCNATYQAFHKRVEAAFGKPSICTQCGTDDQSKTYDWANLNGRYEDINDYQRLCRSCHWKLDQKHKNLGAYARNGGAKCL